MTKSSYGRVMKKKSEKLREKAKRMVLKEYPKLMEDEEMRKKTTADIVSLKDVVAEVKEKSFQKDL